MADLFLQKIKTAKAEIKREIGMRQNFYPKRVEAERMTQAEADQRIKAMQDALDVITFAEETSQPTLFTMEDNHAEH